MTAPTESDPFPGVAVPMEAQQRACPCERGHNYWADRATLHVDEGNAAAQISLKCPDGVSETVEYWTVSDSEFRVAFGHDFDDPNDDDATYAG